MRTIFGLCAVILVVGAVLGWRATRMPTKYGDFTGAAKVQVQDLIERPKDFLGKTVLIEGEVREQCKTMGCFFFFSAGEKTLRVDLQQVAMNAPMHEGRAARAEGQMEVYGDTFQLVANAVEFK
jgi:hypothetical protein